MQGVVIVAGLVAIPVTLGGLIYTLVYGRKPQAWTMAAILWVLLLPVLGFSVLGWMWNSDVDIFGGQDRLDELIAEGVATLEATAAAVPDLGEPEVEVLVDNCFMQRGHEAYLWIQGPEGSAAFLDEVQAAWLDMFGITPQQQWYGEGIEVTFDSFTYWATPHHSGTLSVSTATPGCISLEGQGAWTVWPIMLWATILTGWVAMLRAWPPNEGPRWQHRPEEQES